MAVIVLLNTGDELSSNKERGLLERYSLNRAHGYYLSRLGMEMGAEDILDWNPTGPTDVEFNYRHDSDLWMAFRDTPFTFKDYDPSDWKGELKIGFLMMTSLHEDLPDVESFIDEMDILIYYNSDYEFYQAWDTDWMLKALLREDDPIITKFKSKLKMILVKDFLQYSICKKLYDIEVRYCNYIINDNIPLLNDTPKCYDGFLINLVGSRLDWVHGRDVLMLGSKGTNRPGVDVVIQSSNNTDILSLIVLQSICKYYVKQNSWAFTNDFMHNNPFKSQTTYKTIEAYYAGIIQSGPNLSRFETNVLMSEDYGNSEVEEFRKDVRKTYGYDVWRSEVQSHAKFLLGVSNLTPHEPLPRKAVSKEHLRLKIEPSTILKSDSDYPILIRSSKSPSDISKALEGAINILMDGLDS